MKNDDSKHDMLYFMNFLKTSRLNDGWLTVDEAAKYLGVSKDSLRIWIKNKSKNKLPAYKVGKMWRFKTSELDEWVKNGGAAE